MSRTLFSMLALLISATPLTAQKTFMRSNINPVKLVVDGKEMNGGWRIMPESDPDEYTTTHPTVSFISDCDSITVTLDEWESKDFAILTAGGDTANVRVTRRAINPFENPSPQMLKRSPSGLLSKEQAAFDINALVYALNQVHPDMFSVCRQEDFLRAVNRAISSLPDSVSDMELYMKMAPTVAMIGDGHTNLQLPFNSLFTKELKRLPLFGNILPDKSYICLSSLDSIIPRGAKVMSINGMKTEAMIDSMLPYISGEREHYRLSLIGYYFNALQQMMFPADSYHITYMPEGTKKAQECTFPAVAWDELRKRCPSTRENNKPYQIYSYTTDPKANVAIMDFQEFSDIDGMKVFADSMFRT